MRLSSVIVRAGSVLVLLCTSAVSSVVAQDGSSTLLQPPDRQVETTFEEAMTMTLPGGVDAAPAGGELGEADPPKSSAGAHAQATPGWTTILFEDVEGSFPDDNGWVVYDNNSASGDDYWDDLSCRSYSGSWSAWSADVGDQPDCGNYDNDMTSWMIFGPFDLSDASEARAEFEVWSETERPDIPYDYFFWGASSDGSNFNGYRLTQNTDWSLRELDLTNVPTVGDLTGDSSVWFAFVFVSDSSVNNYEGSYVDDILIEKLVPSQTDLVATDVFFRDQPDNAGNIIDNPTSTDVLYPHFTFSIDGTADVTGKIWQLEINGSTILCSSTTTLSPGSWVGSCNSSITLAPGLHTLHGELDPNGTVTEANESNNDAYHNYDVPGDGPPGSFTLSNETPVCDTDPPGPSPAVRLDWTSSSGATSYDVYRDSALYASGITGTTFYNSAGLVAGQSYSYYVRANNSSGSTDSNTIIVSIPSTICDPDIRIQPLTLTFDAPVATGVQASAGSPGLHGGAGQGKPRIDGQGYDAFFAEQAQRAGYEGHVVGADGEPLSGSFPVEITYFDDDEPLFTERFPEVAIAGGDFRVTLGAGEPRGGERYSSVAELFAARSEPTMEVTVAGTNYGPRLGILPAGHSLESRMVAAGLRKPDDGNRHWEGYRSRNGATAIQEAVLSPPGSDARPTSAGGGDGVRRGPYTLPVVGPVSSTAVTALPVIRAKASREVGEVNPPRHETVVDENGHRYGTTTPKVDDPLAGRRGPTTSTPSPNLTFEGIGNVQGVLPPDTEGAVGPNHYVQVVNDSFAIYDKAGSLLAGPVVTNTLWSGFGGPCETDNSGDAIFLYDQQADRFVLTQFAVASNHQSVCFAVSQTADPTGSYYLYEVVTPRFPDYYKVGVWPEANNNAYFFGTNSGLKGQYDVFALDRANMLIGASARPVQFFQSFDNLMMPADVDGATGPPAGSPGLFYTFRDGGEPYFNSPPTDSLDLWEFDVDWTTPANSTFTMAQSFTPAGGLAEFNWTVCGFFVSNCIPQPGTSQGIDSASWWPMQRLVYRNDGDHEALVGSWTVNVSSSGIRAAPRWFELRNTGSGWSLYQQGTQSPDAIDRWMPSVALDGSGGLAIGYSRGDGTHYPSIYYAARSAGDTLGTLQTEELLYAGTGSQTHSAARWGDYSSMEIDPADDCTFWYTTEYLPTTSSANWHTRVGTFTLPGCSPSSNGSQSFTIYNDGGSELQVSSMALDSSGAWISWSPDAPFSVAAGGSQQVTVSVDFDLAPTGQSTRRLLVSSDDPDESPYPGGVYIVVNKDSSCYALTLGHSGSGADPVANPASSSGCSSGSYHSGESIGLTASPDSGWQVSGWSGTSNDGSTSTSNALVMPASAHSASVTYVQSGGGPPTDLVLANETLSAAATYEACNSITVGPNLFFSAGGAGVVVRAPRIIFIPEVGTLTGAVTVFDGTKPAGCP